MNKSIKDLIVLGIEMQLERYFQDIKEVEYQALDARREVTARFAEKIFNIVYKEEDDDMFDTCTEYGYQKKSIIKPSFESVYNSVVVELDRKLTEQEMELLKSIYEYKPELTKDVVNIANLFSGKDDGDMRVGEE